MITTVLLDLDGVVRHFDPAHGKRVEEIYDLRPGALFDSAFAPDVLTPAILGVITHVEWVNEIGTRVGSLEAAREWTADRGSVDWEMVGLVDELRRGPIRVAVLTNGTTLIASEMVEFGLVDRFDAIFNSAVIGVAKPDVGAFAHVCEELEVGPEEVFFTDDSASKLSGAVELGMSARRFTSVEDFRRNLRELGIHPTGG